MVIMIRMISIFKCTFHLFEQTDCRNYKLEKKCVWIKFETEIERMKSIELIVSLQSSKLLWKLLSNDANHTLSNY